VSFGSSERGYTVTKMIRDDEIDIDHAPLLRCPVCEAVNLDKCGDIHCHRCKSKIFRDPKIATSRAWALLITALIFYIPANLYPILMSQQFGTVNGSTIIGGIIILWEEGAYPIAMIILVASVIVPLLKFTVLLYLLISTKAERFKHSKVNQHKLHYLTEVIGPWSMVDVFVVAILTGLVHTGMLSIIAGAGATAFVLMVLFTMLSAISLDVRLFKERGLNGSS